MAKVKKRVSGMLTIMLTGGLAGVLLGAALVSMLVSYRVDQYHQKISYLDTIIAEKDYKLKKLQESMNDSRFILKDIEVNLTCDEEDKLDEIVIQKHIKEKYKSLIGKDVGSIDADMVEEVINNRIFKVNEKEYKLKTNKILVADVLKLWVTAERSD